MLSQQLKTIRKANKYTQQTLADTLGIERSTYASYETGRNKPDITLLKRIADLFEVPIDVILEIDPQQECDFADMKREYQEKNKQIISTVSDEEKEILGMFRLLSNENKEYLHNLLIEKSKR